MKKMGIIIPAIVITAMVSGCIPKPSINLPAPQINLNVPAPNVNVNANAPGTAPAQQPAIAPGMGTQAAVQLFPYVFSYAFTLNGYWVWTSNFKPGQWTKFRIMHPEEENASVEEIERAFLKKLSDGKEWWRISYFSGNDTLIYEALISPDRAELLRLRVKVPGSEPGDVPVTKGMGYMQPVELTKESIEGATIGVETVKVPAGTFSAKHVKYVSPGSGTIHWWYVDNVPGGVVKYEIKDTDGTTIIEGDLEAYGSGATTILGSF